jgi:hypothetical protein
LRASSNNCLIVNVNFELLNDCGKSLLKNRFKNRFQSISRDLNRNSTEISKALENKLKAFTPPRYYATRETPRKAQTTKLLKSAFSLAV